MSATLIDTPHGPARAHLHPPPTGPGAAKAAMVLGHGAGGGVESADLATATEVAASLGVAVALVEQPYRVAGRRAPAPAGHLDAAWAAAVEHLRAGALSDLPLIVGGRSLGARVACRAADAMGAAGVLCLAFPLQPPQRKGKALSPSRLPELEAVSAPTLIVQGSSDQFGIPPEAPDRRVALVRGDHSLRSDLGAVAAAVRAWLPSVVG